MPTGDVFTYGTLIFAEVMTAVCGERFASLPATLAGFERVRVRGAVYPAARHRAGASIDGVLYLGVGDAALARLDRFEGEMYARRRVQVRRGDGATCEAATYVVATAYAARLEDEPWDAEQFRRDHLASYLARCDAGDVAAAYER
jgi:gamma-glutamylcyclotransferase (GGCT)/AIG2-like uncharacterized protein YtfP